MKAITVKRLPATNTKPARYRASDGEHNHLMVSEPIGDECGYTNAARALLNKLGWTGDWYGGDIHDCTVFVCTRSNGQKVTITREKLYRLQVPSTWQMGSYGITIRGVENKAQAKSYALESYNSARAHDGLEPLKRLPNKSIIREQ